MGLRGPWVTVICGAPLPWGHRTTSCGRSLRVAELLLGVPCRPTPFLRSSIGAPWPLG
jgi:hypothetical protein